MKSSRAFIRSPPQFARNKGAINPSEYQPLRNLRTTSFVFKLKKGVVQMRLRVSSYYCFYQHSKSFFNGKSYHPKTLQKKRRKSTLDIKGVIRSRMMKIFMYERGKNFIRQLKPMYAFVTWKCMNHVPHHHVSNAIIQNQTSTQIIYKIPC